MLKFALTLDDVDLALDPRPLLPEELGGGSGDGFYVETVKVRDPNLRFRARLEKLLLREDKRIKVMIYGHTGSGKSTELVKFQEEYKAKFRFITMSLAKEGLLTNISPVSLLLFIFDQAVRYCSDNKIELDNKLIQSVHAWFTNVVQIEERETSVGAGAEVEVGTKVPLLALLGLTARLKIESMMKGSRLEREVSEKPQLVSELAERTGSVLKAIETGLPRDNTRKIVLIIEDLDKLSFSHAKELFLEEPALLGGLPSRLILLAPISLSCTSRAHHLDSYFERLPFPMIHVLNDQGARDASGVDVLRKIVLRRISSALIADEEINHAAEMTGGIIRSLFEALVYAAEAALASRENHESGAGTIQRRHVDYGLSQVRKTLENRVSIVGLDREFVEANQISVEALVNRLKVIGNGSVTGVPDPLDAVLMEAQALIEYNGEGYRCVNPLLRARLHRAR